MNLKWFVRIRFGAGGPSLRFLTKVYELPVGGPPFWRLQRSRRTALKIKGKRGSGIITGTRVIFGSRTDLNRRSSGYEPDGNL